MKRRKFYFSSFTKGWRCYIAMLFDGISPGGDNLGKNDNNNEPAYTPTLSAIPSSFMPKSAYICPLFVVPGSNLKTEKNLLKFFAHHMNRKGQLWA